MPLAVCDVTCMWVGLWADLVSRSCLYMKWKWQLRCQEEFSKFNSGQHSYYVLWAQYAEGDYKDYSFFLFMNVAVHFHRAVNNVPGEGVRELCLSEALEPSEYSYFNSAVTSTWAGPRHWKLRSKSSTAQKGVWCSLTVSCLGCWVGSKATNCDAISACICMCTYFSIHFDV